MVVEWYPHGMKTTIDTAGRLVVPRALRDAVGLAPGEVEIVVSGAGLRIDAPTTALAEVDGELLLPSTGTPVTADEIRELRFDVQR